MTPEYFRKIHSPSAALNQRSAPTGRSAAWSFYIFSGGGSVNEGLIGYFEAERSE
jgi:hypothetical protein